MAPKAAASPAAGGAVAEAAPAAKGGLPLWIRVGAFLGILGFRVWHSELLPKYFGKKAPDIGSEETCPAGGCSNEASRPSRGPPILHPSISDPNILRVTTQNFNATVLDTWTKPLLVAFYDPRSQSYRDLRPHLTEIAAALAEHEGALGHLGAVDVTVQTYLGYTQAPELLEGWQETQKGGFRFGRPRFYPLIVIMYWEGKRAKEYTGVVSATAVLEFLRRHKAPRGGTHLTNAASVTAFFDGKFPGPYAVGCGMEASSNESATFDAVAKSMHGSLVFGRADPRVCVETFAGLGPPWPKLVWALDVGAFRALEAGQEMSASKGMWKWLSSHQTKVLEEMTPDNSHIYLENPVPLVVYLFDPADSAAKKEGDEVFAEMDHELQRKRFRKDREFQFVWSDCRVFGPQFDQVGKCPSVLVVDPLSMSWSANSMSAVRASAAATSTSLPQSLLAWLRETSAPWRQELDKAQKSDAEKAKREAEKPADEAKKDAEEQALDTQGHLPHAPLERPGRDYVDEVPDFSNAKNISSVEIFHGFHNLLRFLSEVRHSFKTRYGKSLSFSFEAMDKAQALHPELKMLAASEAAIGRILEDPARLEKTRRRIEGRANFLKKLKAGKVKQFEAFSAALLDGWAMLRKLFRRLYPYLHKQAEGGALGQERAPREVERRSAADLSLTEFLERYANPGRPVIITGLNLTEEGAWSLELFKERCGEVRVPLVQRNAMRGSWGRLEKAGSLTMAEFIDTFASNETRRKWYLHDWSLPQGCPAMFGPPPYTDFTVPRYFAGDYFQRAAFDGYQHAWPSLFIGSSDTQSAMHVDSGGTNFWLHLLSGQKEWRFYSKDDMVNLYPNPVKYSFEADVFEPDFEKFPLLKYAQQYVGVQHAGELIFIPGGNPHGVRNLQDIHGISMNYVDKSNFFMYLWSQLADERMDSANWKAFEMFTDNVSIPLGLRSDQEPLRFGDWKSTPWRDLTYDI